MSHTTQSGLPLRSQPDRMDDMITSPSSTDLLTQNYLLNRRIYVISLALQDLRVEAEVLTRISYGGDIWDIRADLLIDGDSSQVSQEGNVPSLEYVASQIDWLRQANSMPIIFTIRTLSQGGRFPDSATQQALELMLLAIDRGCAYVDVQNTWPEALITEICERKGTAKIIASVCDESDGRLWSDAVWREHISQSVKYGDILSLTKRMTKNEGEGEVVDFLGRYKSATSKSIPVMITEIGSALPPSALTSPIVRVGHPLLPPLSSPSNEPRLPSLAEINTHLHQTGRIPKLNFYIIGHNISHSLSPTIHNTAFKELGLPHHYSIHQSPSVDDSVQTLLNPDLTPHFGGASVTFPHKLNILPLLKSQSDAAAQIGAVNTVIVKVDPASGERTLHGDNTDWSGILQCAQSKLSSYNHAATTTATDKTITKPKPERTALVLGAGGAARAAIYAISKLPTYTSIIIVNRSRASAQRLASQFSHLLNITIYTSLLEVSGELVRTPKKRKWKIDLIVGCIPADDVKEEDIPGEIFDTIVDDSEIDGDGEDDDEISGGVVIEMSYRPPVSALMKVAMRHNSNDNDNQRGEGKKRTRNRKWTVFDGVDVLKQQAYKQFELWTGRKAPVSVIEEALEAWKKGKVK